VETVVAFVSSVEFIAHVDGLSAVCRTTVVWVTAEVLVSDICVVVGDGVTAVWVTADVVVCEWRVPAVVERVISVCVTVEVMVSDCCVAAADEGVVAVGVTTELEARGICVAVAVEGVIVVCVTVGVVAVSEYCVATIAKAVATDERRRTCDHFDEVGVDYSYACEQRLG
jgi:hypothetical protein